MHSSFPLFSMNKTLLSAILLCIFAIPLSASATVFHGGDDIHLTDQYNEDSYTGGGRVRVDSTVSADSVVFGGDILINGSTAQDLTLLGGNIRVIGDVGDDLRIAGGQVVVDGIIGDDSLIVGGDIVLEDGATVNGNLFVAGGELRVFPAINGSARIYAEKARFFEAINGDILFYGSELLIDGVISGNAKIVAQKITFGENAKINGDLEYWTASGEADFSGIVQGSSVYNAKLAKNKVEGKISNKGIAAAIFTLVAAVSVWKLLSALVIICVMILATKKYFTDTAKILFKTPWMNMLKGFGVVVGLPMIAITLCITIVGLPLGIAALMMWVMILYFAKICAAVTLTYWYAKYKKRSWKTWQYCGMSLVTYMILCLAFIIPIIGTLAVQGLILIALGALATTKYERFQKVR